MFTSKVHFMLVSRPSTDGKKYAYQYIYAERFPCPDDMDFGHFDFLVGDCRIEITENEKVYCLDTDSWRVAADCHVYNQKGEWVTWEELIRLHGWEVADPKKLAELFSQSFFRAKNFT